MSDQDFFFDEDEAPAKDTAKKAASSDKPANRVSKSAPAASATAQSVSMSVAALIGVIALLAGVIIGILIPVGGANVPAPTSTTPSGGTGTQQSAPQLTPEQLEGGQLPEGHPNIGGGSGGSTETTAK